MTILFLKFSFTITGIRCLPHLLVFFFCVFAQYQVSAQRDLHNTLLIIVTQQVNQKPEPKGGSKILFQNDSEIQKIKIRNQRFIIWFAGIVLFIFLLLLLLLFRLNNQKQKANEALKDKQQILNRNNKNLEEINIQKNNLFSIVAHDVKSPVNAIITSVNMLKENSESFTKEEMSLLTTELSRQAEDLYGLLEGVLAWARSQMDGYNFTTKTIYVRKLIEEIWHSRNVDIQKKNFQITCKIDSSFSVESDYQVLEVILRNLIHNAIKFTNEHGEISFEAEQNDIESRISVRDTGIGIEKDKIEQVFKHKKRYSVMGTNNESGNGIGLILCNEIIRKMGGKIEVESEPNIGSTFTIVIPRG